MRKKLTALLQLTRVNEYYGNTITLTILGALFNQRRLGVGELVIFFAVSLLLTAFAFAINDIEDAEDDAKDPDKVNRNPISAGRLGKRWANIFTLLLAILSLIFVRQFGPTARVLTVVCLVLGFIYSYKKIRLKSVPILDMASHGLFLGAIQFLLPATAHGSPFTPLVAAGAGAIFGISVLGDLKNEVRDYEVDRRTHIRNTASLIDLRPLGKYLDLLYLIPVTALVLVVLGTLSANTRPWFLGLGILVGLIYAGLPKRFRNKIIVTHAQEFITLTGILALFLYFRI